MPFSSPAIAPYLAALYLILPFVLIAIAAHKWLRPKWLKATLVGFCSFFSLWQLYYCWLDTSGREARGHYEQVQYVLARPGAWPERSQLGGEQAVIALSLLAEGLADYSLRFPTTQAANLHLTENALLALLSPELCPFETISDTAAWASRDNNLYLSHVNIILGSYSSQLSQQARAAQPVNTYARLYAQISRHLRARMLAAPTRNVMSYGDYHDTLWVADNAVILHGLVTFDSLTSTAASKQLAQQWVQFITTRASNKQGLPFSEITAQRAPRGCANAWIAKYARAYAPGYSSELWQEHKAGFQYSAGLASVFREYPRGTDLPEDYDSGPMVGGIGTAATGLALTGAKYQQDYYTYYQVVNSLKMAELGTVALDFFAQDEQWAQAANSWLARAIQFNAAAKP